MQEPIRIPRLRVLPSTIQQHPLPIRWGQLNPLKRGPLLTNLAHSTQRNAIGAHGGSYSVYRAIAVAQGQLDPDHRPNWRNTDPAVALGPYPSWGDPDRIVTLDPFGAQVPNLFAAYLYRGYNVQPTIAVTQAHLDMPELAEAVAAGRLQVDGKILKSPTELKVTKAAIDPVWYLPGVAQRLGVTEEALRAALFLQTGGMFPELTQREDLKIFLPPIGNTTAYIVGDARSLANPQGPVSVRMHDECNGSDVFGSDICTCRPYLAQGLEEGIRAAQAGGVGLVVYFRKEGRSLGEVTKYLVYNARKRQAGGDRASTYFARTECVAGVQDARFQELMPDVLHWLGVRHIDRLISMSNLKYDAIIRSGITVGERVPLPSNLIPQDAQVEIEAKKAAGYYSEDTPPDLAQLEQVKGRSL